MRTASALVALAGLTLALGAWPGASRSALADPAEQSGGYGSGGKPDPRDRAPGSGAPAKGSPAKGAGKEKSKPADSTKEPADKSDKSDKSDKGDKAAAKEKPSPKGGAADASWIDRMPEEDRSALDASLGFAPPKLPDTLTWIGGPATTWDDLRGRVVVLQSWTSKSSGGRTVPVRTKELLKDFASDDVVVLFLHTPEGAEKAEDYIKQAQQKAGGKGEGKPADKSGGDGGADGMAGDAADDGGAGWSGGTVIVDQDGAYCDELGVFKRPVNLVIDRVGNVTYAGLAPAGLTKAVAELVKKEADPNDTPNERSESAPAPALAATGAAWPTFSDPVGRARDLRGKQSPPFFVADWISAPATPGGRLVLLDFFATWCGPCMAAVPHMNSIAERYADDVCVVGLSDESKRNFNDGLTKKNKKVRDFKYALGVDPKASMKGVFGISAIPHCAVISNDGIVRWQGHPMSLTEPVMAQLVAAHKSAGGAAKGDAGRGSSKRWEAERRKK